MRRALIIALLLIAPATWAGDFATCILDKAPGVANDTAAQAVYQLCLSENPGGIQAVAQGSGQGWLGYKSSATAFHWSSCALPATASMRSRAETRCAGVLDCS